MAPSFQRLYCILVAVALWVICNYAGYCIWQECVKTQTSSPPLYKKSTLPDCGVNPPAAKAKQYSMSQREEYIDKMKIQMASKDFQQRMAAIDKIVADCKEKPDLVLACKYPVSPFRNLLMCSSTCKIEGV